ncbi:MAG: SDR family oxidoreductase, partial [Pseudomonadota bacterium]|nr:SDR family oxidoreductase [Pseudomonadota bacterium]
MNQKKKIAIITGSSQGLGAAIAIKLSEKGINVVINYSSNEKLAQETMEQCINNGVEAIIEKADVSKDDDCKKLVQTAIDKFGKIDILVNNAGTTKFADHSKLDQLSDEDFISIYKVNVVGPYQMIRAVEPHMRRNGFGSVVNISSIAGKT